MSESRRPSLTIVAKKQGKSKPYRVELYPGKLWPEKFGKYETKYRVRVNRKWVHGDSVWTLSEVMRQLRSLLAKR